MAKKLEPVVLIFGGGINRRRRPFDIDPQECYDGQNFDLDHQFSALHRRNAFQFLGQAPNAQAIRGYAQLVKRDGTITTLIQAGGNIYSWDGTTGFTLVGTCAPTSRLRGAREQTSDLDQLVIITDLEKATVVQQWNGASLSAFSNNLSSPLYAKFCRINNERAYFGNVRSGTDTPHVLLGSELSDIHTLTVTDRPSSALSAADPFFIPTPDLKDINGLEVAFGQFLISTRRGKLHILAGADASDFKLDSLFAGSEVSGDEAMISIGNDVLLGHPGGIDTLTGVTQFGDVENDDVSLWIQPLIEGVTDWTFAYDRTLQKAYCFPENQDLCWVLHKSVLNDGKLSPWSKWTTTHTATFQPSCVIQIVDPSSLQDAVFFGDSIGNVYKIEGRAAKDGGSSSYLANSVDFDGTAHLTRGANLTGAANSSQGILSLWIRPDDIATTINRLIIPADFRPSFSWNGTSHRLEVNFNSGGGDNVVFVSATNSILPDQWSHILLSWDLNFAAGARLIHCYINDVSNFTITTDIGAAFSIAYSSDTNWAIGANTDGTFTFEGCMAEVFFAPGQFLDFSSEANRRFFISSVSQPTRLGNDGSVPTGTAPIIYMKNPAATYGTNSGTGGTFTVNGSFTSCADGLTGPPEVSIDLNRRSIVFRLPGEEVFDIEGTVTYLKKFAATITIDFEYGGIAVFDQTITISIPAGTGTAVYNGPAYYNGLFYYGVGFAGRLTRRKFSAAGAACFVQAKVSVSSDADIEIHEIVLKFRSASET